ncbi:hypothetical protein BU25DRAFT_456464 [Macroventuria anomochaeta]|uniref:Uncharacterized protein n=1 Tax=Macroventuria anomochaeta TaxID=301207 RepID=A0ACB6SA08_9PLEO|nr:uncharacterized protein BU25DRAFT_456464 [Macroventuria anomochaeta]KAF2630054.1 hypothetical protein BU25DRAFT_456464 [Macroventuria anomochaeta]
MTANLPWHPIPSGKATCKVHLIQAGGLAIPEDMAFLPSPDKPNNSINEDKDDKPKKYYAPDYVFEKTLRTSLLQIVKNVLPQFDCESKSPAEILKEHGIAEQQPEKAKAVVFSHMHFDHVGDGTNARFENEELWVGPT